MRDVEMPIGPITHNNVAVRRVLVGNAINLDVRGKNIDNNGVVKRNDAGAALRAPNEFVSLGIHREEVAAYADDRSLMSLDGADEVALDVIWKKLPMNDVNVFA